MLEFSTNQKDSNWIKLVKVNQIDSDSVNDREANLLYDSVNQGVET